MGVLIWHDLGYWIEIWIVSCLGNLGPDRDLMVLEESRATTIAGNKAIAAAPARDGLAIIIYESVKGNARTVPNRIKNKGWIYFGFLTGAELKISEILIINIHFSLYWYFINDADTLIHQ
jgi:hypothetical protein